MANLGNFGIKATLDYLNCASTQTIAANRFIALSTGSPTGATPFVGEVGTGSGYSRQTATWSTTLGFVSATNVNAMTFGPFNAVGTISGIGILDSFATPTVGNILWYGLLATARVVQSGDSLTLAAGNLTSQVS